MSIRAIARFSIKPGYAEQFDELVAAAVEQTRTEDGVEDYSFYMSGQDCVVHEAYRDSAVLAAHLAGPVGSGIFPKALEIADVAIEFFGDLDETARSIAEQLGATVLPGPAYAL